MVLLWGEDGIMIYNDAYATFAGARHPRLLGIKVREGWTEVAAFNDNVMKICLAGGTLVYEDLELVLHRSGFPESVWMNLDYSPVADEMGRPAGVLAVVVETTDRVRLERELRRERDASRAVLDNMGEAFLLLDCDFRIVDVNAEALRLDGRLRTKIVGRSYWEVYPDASAEFGERLRKSMLEVRPVSLEHRYVWPDGRDTWLDMRVYPTDDRLAIFYRDVTARRSVEEALKESDDDYRSAIELDLQTTWTSAPDGQLNRVNRRWFEWTGTTGLGSSYADGLHPADRQRTFDVWGQSVASGNPYDIVHRVKMRDGSFR